MIYLDSNATTGVDPAVVEAMLPFLREHYANPSASYRGARVVHQALDEARAQVAALLGCDPSEVHFTSGGTESDNAAIESARLLFPEKKLLVTAATEHSAVLEPAKRWEQLGGSVIRLPVDPHGMVSAEALRGAIIPGQTALVSLMWANNETGVIFPVEEFARIAHEGSAYFHADAVQAVGKLPINLRSAEIDYLSLSGHKMHAPKGIGALYVSRRVRFRASMLGGGQEKGRRSGTENVPGIVALGAAASLMRRHAAEGGNETIAALRNDFENTILAAFPDAQVHGASSPRLGNTSSIHFPGLPSGEMLILLDELGICCSAGSACHAGVVHPSHVLDAMGHDAQRAASTLRFSLSRFNAAQQIQHAAQSVLTTAQKLTSLKDAGAGPVVLA